MNCNYDDIFDYPSEINSFLSNDTPRLHRDENFKGAKRNYRQTAHLYYRSGRNFLWHLYRADKLRQLITANFIFSNRQHNGVNFFDNR